MIDYYKHNTTGTIYKFDTDIDKWWLSHNGEWQSCKYAWNRPNSRKLLDMHIISEEEVTK